MGGIGLYCGKCGSSGRVRIETNSGGNNYFDFKSSPFYRKNNEIYCRNCDEPINEKEKKRPEKKSILYFAGK